jgi:N-methylhydantoinase B
MDMQHYDPIALQILWSRLIATVDEASATLVRTSFSTVVRESNDFACVLVDAQGRSLAQSTASVPSFIGTLPVTVRHMLREFPPETLVPGDVLLTNDPWMGTGHLPDISVARPVFRDGRLIGFAASVAHSPDIGGRIRSPDAREVFEEGLRIPILKLMKGGELNEDIRKVIEYNVRVPDMVLGDLMAQVAANDMSARRLLQMMDEHGLDNLESLASAIHGYSEAAMREAISRVPDGEYRYGFQTDGFDKPLTVQITMRVEGDAIAVDYAGSSPQVDRALNVVPNYTYAYTAFAIKAALSPDVPNNEGGFNPITVTAPEGSIFNPRFPAAVGGRAVMGHFLPAAVFGALAQVVPDLVQAASGSPLWCMNISGVDDRGRRMATMFFVNGGQGASGRKDGISCISFPSNMSNTPIEVLEHTAPVEIEGKQLRARSGGRGRHRGGMGQHLAVRIKSAGPATLAFLADRTKVPAFGLMGGSEGALGALTLNGKPLDPKRIHVVQPGDLVVMSTPGGGGFGEVEEEEPEVEEQGEVPRPEIG